MYDVYVIVSLSRKYIYVGFTANLNKRLTQHQSGWSRATAPYRPFKLLFTEKYPTQPQAREREKYLKSGIGKEWIKSTFFDIKKSGLLGV